LERLEVEQIDDVSVEGMTLDDYVGGDLDAAGDAGPEEANRDAANGELETAPSNDAGEQVAPVAGETEGQAAESSTPETPAPEKPEINWNSEDNPHFRAAQQMAQLQQAMRQRQTEAQQQQLLKQWSDEINEMAALDESEIPEASTELIAEIQSHAVQPWREALQTREQQVVQRLHQVGALSAAVHEVLGDDQREAVLGLYRDLIKLRGPDEMSRFLESRKQTNTQVNAQVQTLQQQIEELQAQLTIKDARSRGLYQTESSANIGDEEAEVDPWESMLAGV
jgi:hypothetical protein